MKVLGLLRYFLKIPVAPSPQEFSLAKQNYIHDILSQAGLTDDKTTTRT